MDKELSLYDLYLSRFNHKKVDTKLKAIKLPYIVSDTGTLYSIKNERYIKSTDSGGYIRLSYAGKSYGLNRIIYTVFKGEIPKNKVIDHINSNTLDNSISNLQVISTTENNKRSRVYSKGYKKQKVVKWTP